MNPSTVRWTPDDARLIKELRDAVAARMGVPNVRTADLLRMALRRLAEVELGKRAGKNSEKNP